MKYHPAKRDSANSLQLCEVFERELFLIRPECPADIEAITLVNQAAFGQPGEADLVVNLRKAGVLRISLVAEIDDQVIGHIAFSPMKFDKQPEEGFALGLGPMAVLPAFQIQGIGLGLLEAGLETSRQQGADLVIVLGHPDFYPKAGFEPASRFGILCEYPAPDEAFMALELLPNKIQTYAGVARYHPVFNSVT